MAATAEPPATTVASSEPEPPATTVASSEPEPPATTVAPEPEPEPEPEPPATTVASPTPEPPAVATGLPAPEPEAASPTPGPSATATAAPALGLPATMMTSLWELQQSYLLNCQVGLNNQINLELSTAYLYRSVASYFDGSNLTLSAVTQFFQGQSTQMWLHNQHGGLAQQPDVNNPVGNNPYSTPMAEPCPLCLAMSINQALLNLQQQAAENSNGQSASVPPEQPGSTQEAGDHPTSVCSQEQPEATQAESLQDKFSQGDQKN